MVECWLYARGVAGSNPGRVEQKQLTQFTIDGRWDTIINDPCRGTVGLRKQQDCTPRNLITLPPPPNFIFAR